MEKVNKKINESLFWIFTAPPCIMALLIGLVLVFYFREDQDIGILFIISSIVFFIYRYKNMKKYIMEKSKRQKR